MAELKIGRRVFDITEKDIVMFNGACWQLITQTIHSGWNNYYPTVSKTLCGKLLKKNIFSLMTNIIRISASFLPATVCLCCLRATAW